MRRISLASAVAIVAGLSVSIVAGAAGQIPTPDDRGFDPTGTWKGRHGTIVLARAGDTLSFSYSAVFGETAHICDGIGVAGFVGDATWAYVDGEGTITFTTKGETVAMATTSGIASFCGANWPGDTFDRKAWTPASKCVVKAPKATFRVVSTLPPPERKGYVVNGDQVEAIRLVNERSDAWVLARYVGKSRTTAGLLERVALECPPK